MELREKSASQLAICEREKRSDRSGFTVVGELRWVHGGELRWVDSGCGAEVRCVHGCEDTVKKMVHASVRCSAENGEALTKSEEKW
ncbi:hypothetical protein Pint_15885 [Pistacia integerrima]|uniref:Uncharacterized protein n=1 Tax=Pistacia integerrima TaxID=434235 RepID=A0ACC0ZFQ1_9ROSI|nr:hypothetical protein Pint_15885 [Pistacia integerrima]